MNFKQFFPPTILSLGLSLCFGTMLQAQTLYKWQDEKGQVHYTDAPPPPKAKLLDEKRGAIGSVIENNQESFASQEAQKRHPVTLYANDCGEFCDNAKGMVNKRGVPHKVIDPSVAEEFEKFKQLTGGTKVPVLKVGESLLSGFNEAQWQAALDKAGYPKAPPPRSQALKQPPGRASDSAPEGDKTAKSDKAEKAPPAAEKK